MIGDVGQEVEWGWDNRIALVLEGDKAGTPATVAYWPWRPVYVAVHDLAKTAADPLFGVGAREPALLGANEIIGRGGICLGERIRYSYDGWGALGLPGWARVQMLALMHSAWGVIEDQPWRAQGYIFA